ncbi:MAG: hypothetical protein WCH98_21470, partial [Verrucomicrobiota bacterium]
MKDIPTRNEKLIPRRQFLGGLAVAGTALAIPAGVLAEEASARPQAARPLKGHFHPKGKAPSKFTTDILQRAKTALPFSDTRDFDEQKRGLIAPMKDMKIMADGGHVAWDMEEFQFLNQKEEFDSIHPSLHRQSLLNNNYGLYEVVPGIYQVRGFDLANITFIKGRTGWIAYDVLVTAEPARAAWKLFQEHVGGGLQGYFVDISGRELAEMALRESQERLDLALQAAELGVWDWDVPSGAVVFSDRWARMLG